MPAGVTASAVIVSHSVWLSPASKTCEVKVPSAAYGPMRSQSTFTTGVGVPPAEAVKSLASGRRSTVGALACAATWTPSTKYVTPTAVQTIR